MTISMPEKVEFIIDTLMEHGFEAYAVGGCVRDMILGRNPEDWDITTSATPQEVKNLFRRTIDTGIQHGTVTVMLDKDGYEVTTYRIDGEYEDNRHPKDVAFTKNLLEDLKRRDFTINAMAYNNRDGLVDAFDGMNHIEQKRICCVGNPEDRFDEDALRMLRAVRFSGQLGFSIEEQTGAAIRKKASFLKNISAERIRVELNKLITSKGPEQIREAYRTSMTRVILPEFDVMMETEQNNPHHIYTVGEHTIHAVQEIGKNGGDSKSILCWTMLLHDVAKPLVKTTDELGVHHFYGHAEKGSELSKSILKRLKFDNYTIDMVSRLIYYHDYQFTLTPSGMRRAVFKIGEDLMKLLFQVKRADVFAQNPSTQEEKLRLIQEAERLYEEIEKNKNCINLKSLAVNGQDLMKIGFPAGKKLGEVLNQLLEQVLEKPEINNKETLLELAGQYLEK